MTHANRSVLLGRTFFLLVVSLLVAGTQANAQSGKDPATPACIDAACPQPNAEFALAYDSEQVGNLESKEVESPVAPVLSPAPAKNNRLFWVLPNYLFVENLDKVDRLSAKTKFKLSAKTMTDPVTVSFIGVVALMGQARNSDPSYGQGFQGYEKRYATFYADTGINTLMTTSVFPTLLHQDPRYFQLGSGSGWRRAFYSMSRIFVTRADSGETQFNYSEIIGTAAAAGISYTYHPRDQRTLGNTATVWGTGILMNMMCNVAKEFWPDIRRKFAKEKHPN